MTVLAILQLVIGAAKVLQFLIELLQQHPEATSGLKARLETPLAHVTGLSHITLDGVQAP